MLHFAKSLQMNKFNMVQVTIYLYNGDGQEASLEVFTFLVPNILLECSSDQ